MAEPATPAFDGAKYQRRWRLELDLAESYFQKWEERADKIVKRYRDERDRSASGKEQFNILWSNVQTIRPAVYAKSPKPEVSRRYNDQDPVGRTASTILERCLEYEVEHYPDFNSAMRNSLDDRLLPGRGVCWSRYDPNIETVGESDDDTQTTEDTEQSGYEQIKYECAPTDYVAWKDFRHQPARTWEEVNWVARRVYMYREDLHKRFDSVLGADEVERIPCDRKPENFEKSEHGKSETSELLQAEIWEIWDKRKSEVIWLAEGFDRACDVKSDPLGLDCFYPCPKPLFATLTTDSLIPIPDYCQYQDQAQELDLVTERIGLLEKAVRVAGVYDSTATGLKNLLSNTGQNVMIPVTSWAMFAEKGGIKGAVDWFPLDQVVAALEVLYNARDRIKQTIYEITGLADIVRGASDAAETATAQQIKSQFASLRIQELQNDMARYATDVLRMKAQIICNHFQPETILEMSGAQNTLDAQYIEPAMQLLKSQPIRSFRIEVNSDSMVELDVEQEKADRVEFLGAIGGFLQSALPVAQNAPAMLPLLGELLRFGVRGFKAGREVEAAFDTAMQAAQQAPQIPPEVQQMQAQLQEREAMLAEQEQGLMQQQETMKGEADKLNQDKMAFDYQQKEFALQQKAAQDREKMKGEVEKFQQQQTKEVETFKQKGLEQVGGAISEHMSSLDKFAKQVGEALQQMAETVAQVREEQAAEIKALSESVQQTQALIVQYAKAKRTPIRGPDGRVAGVNVEGFTETMQ